MGDAYRDKDMRAIFISYRRDDAEGQAGRLFDDLLTHFEKVLEALGSGRSIDSAEKPYCKSRYVGGCGSASDNSHG